MDRFPATNGLYQIGFFDGSTNYTLDGSTRDIMYRCFYPASSVSGDPAYYLDEDFVNAFCAAAPKHPLLSAVKQSQHVYTNCYQNTEVADGQFPVLLYSHGMANLPWGNLAQIEHLVANGYIVFAVVHIGDTFTTLPDSDIGFDIEHYKRLMEQMVGFMLPDKPNPDDWTAEEISDYIRKCTVATERVKLWTEDINAVVASLIGLNIDSILANHINIDKIGTFGFSFGGAASVRAALYNNRILAGVNIDGFQMGADLLERTICKPCLYITKSSKHYTGNYGTNNPLVKCLEISGASNLFMMDYCLLDADTVKSFDRPTPTITSEEMTNSLNNALSEFFSGVFV